MAVNNSQDISVGIISIAYRAFGRIIACNSAHSIIEDITDLTACVGDLLADIELIVLIALGGLQKTPPLFPRTEKSFLI